jgi:tryptophanyl-tRNA synthetase
MVTTAGQGKKSRVLSGMRPTGRLHIGHYFGALQNWVRLQNDPAYECFYFIADWHALTSDYADTSGVAENTLQIMIDYLAAGLDPQKSVLFQQSVIPEHAELHLLLSMVTPLGWLERVPTYKEALENVKDRDLHNYGFLGYPILQCADIVIYSKEGAHLFVPVGEDQVSHVEISREIVRRFNGPPALYGLEVDQSLLNWFNRSHVFDNAGRLLPIDEEVLKAADRGAGRGRVFSQLESLAPAALTRTREEKLSDIRREINATGFENFREKLGPFANDIRIRSILCEPDAMLTKTPRIPGLDGRKMSKSYGNAITLSETDEEIRKKTKVMVTDPARKRRTDPGNPDVCPVYDWHKLFSAEEPGRLAWVRQGCTAAGIGCIECKAAMAENLIKWIAPVRERRAKYEKNPKQVLEILDEGSRKARAVAQGTMERVREAVFGWGKKRAEIGGGKKVASGE